MTSVILLAREKSRLNSLNPRRTHQPIWGEEIRKPTITNNETDRQTYVTENHRISSIRMEGKGAHLMYLGWQEKEKE